MMEYIYVITLIVTIYLIGCGVSISNSTTSYHCKTDFSSVDTKYRDARPKDAWVAIIWPLRVIIGSIWLILSIINDLVCYPLLLLGITYKDTKLYKIIDKASDDKF